MFSFIVVRTLLLMHETQKLKTSRKKNESKVQRYTVGPTAVQVPGTRVLYVQQVPVVLSFSFQRQQQLQKLQYYPSSLKNNNCNKKKETKRRNPNSGNTFTTVVVETKGLNLWYQAFYNG